MKVIAQHELTEKEAEAAGLQKDIELAGLRKERDDIKAKTDGLAKDLKKAKLENTTQMMYKASLRSMLDKEKEKFKLHKQVSEQELSELMKSERNRASDQTENALKKQKNAMEKVKELEAKYNKSAKNVADRDAELILKVKPASERSERAVRTPAGPPWDPSNTPQGQPLSWSLSDEYYCGSLSDERPRCP